MAKEPLPPPGQMFDVGGFRLHMLIMGSGSPTVVFEAGFLADALTWSLVQPEIAKLTQTCSYDRAGMGWSDPSPNPVRRRETLVQELHDLLEVAKIEGPLVLVGWSAGGIYVRHFAQCYPERVAGMVLVDSSHENGHGRISRAAPDLDAIFEENRQQRIEDWRSLSEMNHEQILEASKSMRPPAWNLLPDERQKLLDDRLRPEVMQTRLQVASDTGDFQLGDDALQSLGSIPLIALATHNQPKPPFLSEEQHARSSELKRILDTEVASTSTDSQLIWVECGHAIQVEQPQAVIDAITEVVMKVRAA